jgi:hypothetical protein
MCDCLKSDSNGHAVCTVIFSDTSNKMAETRKRNFRYRCVFSAIGFVVGIVIVICFTTVWNAPATAALGGVSSIFAGAVFAGTCRLFVSSLQSTITSLSACKQAGCHMTTFSFFD